MQRVRDIEGLLDLAAVNPGVAKGLKRDPRLVAEMLGVELTEDEATLIAENLDIDLVLEAAETANTMATKVAQGIGLQRLGGESSST